MEFLFLNHNALMASSRNKMPQQKAFELLEDRNLQIFSAEFSQ
jgi:hypothetical protein